MPGIVTITLNPALDVSTSVPRIVPVHKLRCAAERRDPGGGGINVARVISRLGGEVRALFPAGGPIGQYLQRLLRDEAIDCHVIPIAGVTRESFTVIETETGEEYRFVLPGPSLNASEFAACLAAIAQAGCPPYVIASGSLPPGAPANAYAQLAAAARACGAKFVIDASGEALRLALAEGVYLAKPNLRELRDLTGASLDDEASIVEATRDLVRTGQVEVIALSRGAQGALLVTRDEIWGAEAIQGPIASSVGAGDSFLASLIWSLGRGDDLETAFRYALAGGAASLMAAGTTLCSKADVERLAATAAVRRL